VITDRVDGIVADDHGDIDPERADDPGAQRRAWAADVLAGIGSRPGICRDEWMTTRFGPDSLTEPELVTVPSSIAV